MAALHFGGNLGIMLAETLNAADEAATLPDLRGCGTVSVQITGTFSGTVTFEVSNDGTNWVAVPLGALGTGVYATTTTTTGIFVGCVAAFHKFRARCSAYTSGDIVATLRAVPPAAGVGDLALSPAALAQGASKQVSASFTRPSDTTAYATGDAVTNSTSAPVIMTFDGCSRIAAGSGFVVGAMLISSANQATLGSFELWLFDTTATPDNDNAVFTPTDAECATLVAVIPLTTTYIGDATSGVGGNVVYESAEMVRPFVCGAASDDLFGLLVVRNAYTPVSAEVFTVQLRVLQD